TNILNTYETQDQIEKRQAEFEKLYKKYEEIPMPRITDVKADVDIYPQERSVNIKGTYLLKNKLSQPIDVIHLTLNRIVKINKIDVPNGKLEMRDSDHGYYIYRLAKPMAAGESITISYDLAVENKGFVNGRSNTKIVYNGTFFDSDDYFPHLGYTRGFQLQDKNKRKKYGLPPVERMPDLDNAKGRNNIFFTHEADWINFETTVSTSADQIAIAPGYLQKEWTQNGRRYFHYKMDSPILDFWSYLSAR